jgi:hypothetical protein
LRGIAARHLLDVIGCGLAAVGTGDGGHATEVALAAGGQPDATVLGSEARLPVAVATFANGTRFHALDFDDTHEEGICHVSAVVAPAALASGGVEGLDFGDLLDALASAARSRSGSPSPPPPLYMHAASTPPPSAGPSARPRRRRGSTASTRPRPRTRSASSAASPPG